MDLNARLSCDGFPSASTSSEKIKSYYSCDKDKAVVGSVSKQALEPKSGGDASCIDVLIASSTTSSSTLESAVFNAACRDPKVSLLEPPDISYEMCLAKSIMQQFSSISGDNLYDHLSDIIKRIIDERPPNVIDFFEEFSRSVREQKFHLPERFPPNAVFEESRMYRIAKQQLISMKLPYQDDSSPPIADEMEEERAEQAEELKLDIDLRPVSIYPPIIERVQHMHFFWNQCGFSISSDDIFQLACSMTRLQTHPSILQCRFWGIINGLKAPYYVVEAYLTNEEIDSRLAQMEREMIERFKKQETPLEKETLLPKTLGAELIPGAIGWENWPDEELMGMKPEAAEIPTPETIDVFDIPPEPIGLGVNRYVYFVVNSLSDEWIELPIVTPKQIKLSRQLKKFFTGNLEADIVSYPCFRGKEKHYLRAMVSRITAGTYVAPRGYYRKMTKKERRLFDGMDEDEGEEEEEEEEEIMGEGEEEGEPDNDVVLLKNEKYEILPAKSLNSVDKWLHIRPNILEQGRVIWFDEEKARREREKERKRLEKLRLMEEMGDEEGEEEEEEEEEEEGEEEGYIEGTNREIGPNILSACSFDNNTEVPVPWVRRFTSNYTNEKERMLIMQSNVWPGAYTFIYQDICESIYMGWGHKSVSRNMPWLHLPHEAFEYPHGPEDFLETEDPTVEMEEAYRLSKLKRELAINELGEHLSDYEDETHESNDREDDEEEEEEEEEE
uniref:Radial spokehead-like protein n=1 Tax=Glossina austeni TaxID=7395 RepID=A0A1A9VG21_GLOAU